MNFTDEQRAAIERRDGGLLLSANAGSGKTSVLVERFVRAVLEDGIAPGRLLAITFTDKAAGELRARLRGRLVELGARDAAREMDAAWVSTIHGFCARVLRTHAVAAGLDPRFAVLDEAAARALRTRAWDEALAGFLDPNAGPEARQPSQDAGPDAPPSTPVALELVAGYGPDRLRETIEHVHDELRSQGAVEPRLPASRARGSVDEALRRVRQVHGVVAAELAAATRSLKTLDAARETVAAATQHLAADDAAALAGLRLGSECAELKTPACDELRAALATLAAAVVDERALADWALLDELLSLFAERYAAAKRARAAVDYDDLELGVAALFARDPALAAAYAERFERVMVDEFQDTNPLQLRILAHIDRDDVFAVGDELQSIYGFRHADVGGFRAARDAHEARGQAAVLRTNWRAHPELLHTVNAWLGRMHDRYERLLPGRDDPVDADTPRTELLVVDTAWDGDGVDEQLADRVAAGLPAARLARQAEARAVARRVREIIDEDGRRPGDVVVLLRAATDLQLFERALELEDLPTLASGGRGFWGRQQVQDLTSYLAVLANPRDELALYSTLASPLCGLSSDALALLARDPQAPLPPADAARLTAFQDRLDRERDRAPRLRLDELIARAVADSGYDLHVLRQPGGRRRLANIHKLERLAAAYEATGGRDLRGFIDHARAELDADAREPEAPIDPGDRSAVALMTIHAAKGLEFPVVVVAELGRQRAASTPRILFDGERTGLSVVRAGEENLPALDYEELQRAARARELEEERRILHVAVTRAEERLVLSGSAKLGEDGRWPRPSITAPALAELGPLLDAALPIRLSEQATIDVDERRGDDVLRLRVQRVAPADAAATLGIEVGEGQLAFDLPAAAATSDSYSSYTEDELSLVAPPAWVPAALSYSQLAGYDRCGYRYYLERVLRLPPVPETVALPAPAAIAGMDPLVRGGLLHELLETIPGVPSDEQLDALAAQRGLELEIESRADLRALAQAFHDSPWAARLAGAGDVQREAVFAYPVGDAMVTGVVDVRAREDSGRALVIDYKTDRLAPETDLEAHVEHDYGAQRRIYALAELRAGAREVEVVHLYLERPGEPAVARYTRDDMTALEADLRARMAGIRRGDFPVTDTPYLGVCRGCPGRGTLCPQPLELTERLEAPPPSASPAAA